MKPIIAVSPLWDDKRSRLWIAPEYLQWIELAGAVPFLLPMAAREDDLFLLLRRCDGILLTGGHDVDPSYYGAVRAEACGPACLHRDEMEFSILRYCMEHRKPVFGICRGLQVINVFFGGTLWQDLPSERPADTQHGMQPPYDRAVHKVQAIEGTGMGAILGRTVYSVNSLHHQAVRDLAPGLRCTALSEDGLVEAVEYPQLPFCMAVQWHPEYLRDTEDSQKLVAAFVAACQN